MLSVKLIFISGPETAQLTIILIPAFIIWFFIFFKQNIWWTLRKTLLWVELVFSSKYILRAVYFCLGNETRVPVQHCMLTYGYFVHVLHKYCIKLCISGNKTEYADTKQICITDRLIIWCYFTYITLKRFTFAKMSHTYTFTHSMHATETYLK